MELRCCESPPFVYGLPAQSCFGAVAFHAGYVALQTLEQGTKQLVLAVRWHGPCTALQAC